MRGGLERSLGLRAQPRVCLPILGPRLYPSCTTISEKDKAKTKKSPQAAFSYLHDPILTFFFFFFTYFQFHFLTKKIILNLDTPQCTGPCQLLSETGERE